MSTTTSPTLRPRGWSAVAAVAVVLALALVGCGGGSKHGYAAPANAHGDPQTIFTPGTALFRDPTGTIAQLHALGVDRVRIFLFWNAIAPKPASPRAPHFDAADPAAYPRVGWARYDAIIHDVLAAHLGLDVVLGPPPPRWATGPGAPPRSKDSYGDEFWDPNAADFGEFVQAVGTRYSGHYTPKGSRRPLPRVSFWSIWNEPNDGVDLAPQTLTGNQVESAPRYYRALTDAAWSALGRTGHGSDTTLVGELAPVGSFGPTSPGQFRVMTPLRFLRALYCVDANYKPLSGSAAAARGCPTTSAASKRFAAQNPALFHASAFADHPYSFGPAPDKLFPGQPDDTNLAAIDGLFSALDRAQSAYGSHRQFQVYSTEYGYQTDPPDTQAGLITPRLAATWLNWSEYLSWREPRLLSYDQYLLDDPLPPAHGAYKAYATGILTYLGARKPSYYAFRMPIWMPQTRLSGHHPLEVWGCARPAKLLSPARRSPASIQWRGGTSGAWRTIARVPVASRYAYFDVHERFPGPGQVRITWSAPGTGAIHSRVTVLTG